MIATARFIFIVLALLSSACISSISTRKVKRGENPKGIRMHLPAPFVVGRPNPSGEITWSIEYLPDPDEEYAVHAWSIMAKNIAKFSRNEAGMLTALEFDIDTASVAEQFLKSAKAVAPEALKAIKAKDDAAETARQNVATAKETARTQAKADAQSKMKVYESAKSDLEAARIELRKKKTLLEIAENTLDTAQLAVATNTDSTKTSGLLTGLTQAQKDHTAALADHQTADKTFTAALNAVEKARFEVSKSVDDAFDNGSAAVPAVVEKKKEYVPGPVIFRIVEEAGHNIRLEPVRFELFAMNGRKRSAKQIETQRCRQLLFGTWGVKPQPKQ